MIHPDARQVEKDAGHELCVPDTRFCDGNSVKQCGVDGYVVEGHVPADVIVRLLEEDPEVIGLSVPGMPVGSPGMEGPNPQPYNVVTFDKEGHSEIYERR